MNDLAETSPRLVARTAGFLYLITIVTGVFSAFFVNSALVVRNDPVATASHIAGAETLYRFGLAAELVGTLGYVGVTAFLYVLLRPVSRIASVLAALFSSVGCAVGVMNVANQAAPLLYLGNMPYLTAFTPAQLQVLAFASLRLEAQANNVGLICFAFYCALIGWMIFRSTFLPRAIGVLMLIAGAAWMVNGFAVILLPALAAKIFPIIGAGIIGEGSLCLWLILAGVNVERWQSQADLARGRSAFV
jgi:hypothetical protein